MKSGERPWKCRAVENEENQTQVSLVSPCLWKSLRDSHIPTAPATAVFQPEYQSEKPKKGAQHTASLNFTPSGSSLD
jgi:hypothetical protein